MAAVTRVLDPTPVPTLDDYVAGGGGRALAAVADLDVAAVVELVAASGLRGRGGAGFPTGLKWRTVAASAGPGAPSAVVVNAAEGEPGTFKDRELLRRNPYRVLEGALVAAYAMTAPRIVVATKASFRQELSRLHAAIDELAAAEIATDIAIDVVEGPDSYLFGEETALLEVVDGHHPFPRVAPPYRRGLEPDVQRPVLVDNVETLANVAGIVVEGAEWFRSAGTSASPGTIVCTVSGDTSHHGVGEFAMGTSLAEVIETVGRGPADGRRVVAAITGTANSLITAEEFDTPLCYEAMSAIGSGLGTGGIIVVDDTRDLIDVGRAVSHFLAIESCGQCEPCKLDGQTIATNLREIVTGTTEDDTVDALRHGVGRVGRGARCGLARQQEAVIGDLLVRCRTVFDAHRSGDSIESTPVLIAPIVDLVDGRFVLDERSLEKQPDWTYDEVDSGELPVNRLADVPLPAPTATAAPAPAGEGDTGKAPRDPFAILLDLHERIRDDLDTVLDAADGERRPAASRLEDHLRRHTELLERLVHPMVLRVAADGDDAVWSAELHGLDALEVADALRAGDDGQLDRRSIDRLAKDVRRNLAVNDGVVYPLLREHLDESEQTDLADAIDEILVVEER